MFFFHLMEEGEDKEKKKKKEREMAMGRSVSLGLDPPCWLCHRSQLLGEIKG
jgi:hypothetical protein